MTGQIIEFLACVLESIICSVFITKYFGFISDNKKWLKQFIFFIGSMIPEILVTYTNLNEYYCILIFVSIFFILSIWLLNDDYLPKLLISCMIYILIIAINLVILTTFSSLMTAEYSDIINQTGMVRVLIILITKLILAFVLGFFLRLKKSKSITLNRIDCLIIILTFVITSAVGFTIRDILKTNEQVPERFIFITCCMIGLNLIIFDFLIKSSRHNKKEHEMQLLEFQLKQQEKSMIETDKCYEEATKIRHDIKNYISCALLLAENGEYDELINYLRDFSNLKLGKIKRYVTTESRVLNAVLNSKLSTAQENSIAIDCVITGILGTIRELDISILLSNLLDNAIEACMKNTLASTLHVELFNQASYLCIKIKNTYDAAVLGQNPDMKTTKPDKENHGIGLKSVKDIVDKYSGSMKYFQQDNEFVVEIILCNC